MSTPHETTPDWTIWGGLIALIGFCLKYFKDSIKPREWLAWLNEPTMRPVHDKLDYLQRVFDKLPDADKAHAAVRAEDEKERYNWE